LRSTVAKTSGSILALWLIALSVSAQITPEPVGADSLKKALIPVLGYDSDIGLHGGLLYNRIDYSGKAKPFKTYFEAVAVASTKGMIDADFEYERTRSFNSDIRSRFRAFLFRFNFDYYFGIGNRTEFNDRAFDDDFYFFESLTFALRYEGRYPLYRDLNGESRLDLLFGAGTQYEIPYVKQDSSRFNFDRPNGFTGGWVNYMGTGLVWENRNSEFDPTAGNRAEIRIRAAPTFLLSDFGLATFQADYRHYFRLFDWVTVANRLQLRHAEGDVPYWERSRLGNERTLRGYPLNRFIGNSSVAYSLELRKWLIRFPRASIRLGGHLFTDVGRVFTEEDDFGDLLRGYKQTVGLGSAMSLFNPDFILRAEAGFSEDLFRIYVGIGYTF